MQWNQGPLYFVFEAAQASDITSAHNFVCENYCNFALSYFSVYFVLSLSALCIALFFNLNMDLYIGSNDPG